MTQNYKKILTLLVIGAAMSAGSLPCHGKELKLKSVHHINMNRHFHGPVATPRLRSTFDAGKLKAVTPDAGSHKVGVGFFGPSPWKNYHGMPINLATGPSGTKATAGWARMATAHAPQKTGLTLQQQSYNNAMGWPSNGIDPGNK